MPADKLPRKLLFVINPISGGRDKSWLPALIEQFCSDHQVEHLIKETTEKFDPKLLRADVQEFKPNAVIACGGDGTVNFIGKTLLDSDIPLGIIPLGSSNALAKNLFIPLKIDQALTNLLKFNVRAIDTLDVDGNCCLHVFDIGFNARLIERFHTSKIRGMVTYGWYLIGELFWNNNFRYKVVTPQKEVAGKAFSITVTNTKSYGSGVEINPKGKADDGKFEICIVKPFPKAMIIPLLIKLIRGALHHSKYSLYIRTRTATLYNKKLASAHIDGEPINLGRQIEIVIKPKSLKVIVPENLGT